MTKRALYLILAGMLCASVALAGQTNSFSLGGQYPNGSFMAFTTDSQQDLNWTVQMDFNPIQLPDGTVCYLVQVSWLIQSPDNPSIYAQRYVDGFVPLSAITAKGPWGPVQVNITHDSFITTTGDNPPSPTGNIDDFASLVGTFTPYTGPGSDTTTTKGTSTETQVLQGVGGDTITLTFNGVSTTEDATFTGTFGTTEGTQDISVEPPPSAGTASLTVQVGTMIQTITPPPGE